jgi:DNA-binding MarR family transcriptional regulator
MIAEFRLENEVHFVLRNASMAVERLCHILLKSCDITYPQYIVLTALWEEDGLLSGGLALRLGVNASTVSRALKRLEMTGLVSRQRDQSDERTVHVWLTAAGKEIETKTRPLRARLAALSGMTEEEMKGMHRMVQRFQCESARLT